MLESTSQVDLSRLCSVQLDAGGNDVPFYRPYPGTSVMGCSISNLSAHVHSSIFTRACKHTQQCALTRNSSKLICHNCSLLSSVQRVQHQRQAITLRQITLKESGKCFVILRSSR